MVHAKLVRLGEAEDGNRDTFEVRGSSRKDIIR